MFFLTRLSSLVTVCDLNTTTFSLTNVKCQMFFDHVKLGGFDKLILNNIAVSLFRA